MCVDTHEGMCVCVCVYVRVCEGAGVNVIIGFNLIELSILKYIIILKCIINLKCIVLYCNISNVYTCMSH